MRSLVNDFCKFICSYFFQVIAEVAAPISQTKRVTMVAGPGGELGIHKLTGEILDTVSRLPVTVEKMTGVDVSKVRFSIIR